MILPDDLKGFTPSQMDSQSSDLPIYEHIPHFALNHIEDLDQITIERFHSNVRASDRHRVIDSDSVIGFKLEQYLNIEM